jgi:hypothetical protein
MPDAHVGHEPHAVVRILLRSHGDDLRRHDGFDARLLRRPAEQDDLSRVVALGDDADQPLARHHEQRSDVVLGHLLDRGEHGIIRRHRVDSLRLVIQQLLHGKHRHLRRRIRRRLATEPYRIVRREPP